MWTLSGSGHYRRRPIVTPIGLYTLSACCSSVKCDLLAAPDLHQALSTPDAFYTRRSPRKKIALESPRRTYNRLTPYLHQTFLTPDAFYTGRALPQTIALESPRPGLQQIFTRVKIVDTIGVLANCGHYRRVDIIEGTRLWTLSEGGHYRRPPK